MNLFRTRKRVGVHYVYEIVYQNKKQNVGSSGCNDIRFKRRIILILKWSNLTTLKEILIEELYYKYKLEEMSEKELTFYKANDKVCIGRREAGVVP